MTATGVGSTEPAESGGAGLAGARAGLGGTLRQELIGLGGIVERNVYLTRRYFLWDLAFMVWTIANTLTIVFIARGVHLGAAQENELATKLLIGAVIWAFLGIIFEFVTETVAWERWEGTIESRRSRGSAGRGRSSTRSWRRCRALCTSSARVRSPFCTA